MDSLIKGVERSGAENCRIHALKVYHSETSKTCIFIRRRDTEVDENGEEEKVDVLKLEYINNRPIKNFNTRSILPIFDGFHHMDD